MIRLGGHRGSGCTDSPHAEPYGRFKPPENTLPSIAQAIRTGADFIEIDVVQTKDNKLAVTHSNALSQHVAPQVGMKTDMGFVSEYTLADLKKIPVGMHQKGEMPELCEVFDVCKNVVLNIEIKDAKGTHDEKFKPGKPLLLELLAEVLTAYKGEVLLSSFSMWDILKAKELMPKANVAMLFAGLNEDERPIYQSREDASRYLQFTPENIQKVASCVQLKSVNPCMGCLTKEAVKTCETLGLEVAVWSMDERPPQENPSPVKACVQLCQKFNRPLTIITDFIPEMRQFLEKT